MRKIIKQSWFVYVLCLAVMLTLGMQSQPKTDHHNENSTASAAQSHILLEPMALFFPPKLAIPLPLPSVMPVPDNEPAIPEVEVATADPEAEAPNEPDSNAELEPEAGIGADREEAIGELPSEYYEVTAYFLNVRADSNADSNILKTIEQGTRLEIVNQFDNGWLELKDGGFINGRYAVQLQHEGESSRSEVEILSIHTYDHEQQEVHNEILKEVHKADDSEAVQQIAAYEPNEPTSDVESSSGLTKEHIEKLFEGSALADNGLEEAILDIEEMYGINAYFTIAVMKLESGHGKSQLAKKKNNLFGLNAIDGDKYNKAFSFKTKGDSVQKFGQLLADHYVGKGLTTIEKVAKKYCPTDSKWASMVKSIMKSDYKKL